jgi:hypothetical protein
MRDSTTKSGCRSPTSACKRLVERLGELRIVQRGRPERQAEDPPKLADVVRFAFRLVGDEPGALVIDDRNAGEVAGQRRLCVEQFPDLRQDGQAFPFANPAVERREKCERVDLLEEEPCPFVVPVV